MPYDFTLPGNVPVILADLIDRATRAGNNPGGGTVSARVAPTQTPPVLDNVTATDTGTLQLNTLSQSVSFLPQNMNFKGRILTKADGTGGLEVVGLSKDFFAIVSRPSNTSLAGNIAMTNTDDPDRGVLTFSSLPNGDLEVRQGGTRRALVTAATVLAVDADYRNSAATYGRFVGPAQFANVSLGAYRVEYLPLRVVDASFAASGVATVTFDYYMPTDDVIELEIRGTTGQTVVARAAAVVTENATPGRATVQCASAPISSMRGNPLSIVLRQRTSGATATVQRVWSAPMSLGINPVPPTFFYLMSPTSNKQDLKWRDGHFNGNELPGPLTQSPQVDFKGNVLESDATRAMRPSDLISPPRINGQRMRWRWKGQAKNVAAFSNGDSAATNVVYGSDSTYSYMDFNYNYDFGKCMNGDAGGSLLWLEYAPDGTGSTWPNSFELIELAGNNTPVSSGFWDPYFITEYAKFAAQGQFQFRCMDYQNAVGLAYEIISRPSQQGDRRAGNTVSLPDILDLMTLTGCTPKLHMPMRATDSYIRTEARRSAVWAKANNKPVSWRLANEIWNPGQNNWRVAYDLAKSDLGLVEGSGPGQYSNNGLALRYWSYRHKYVMTLVTEEFVAEGVPQLLHRAVELQNANPGNTTAVLYGEPGCIDYVDAISVAPYLLGGKGTDINDVATLATRARQDFPVIHGFSAQHRDFAFSIGKGFETYEGGYEEIGNPALWRAFSASQEGHDVTTELLNHWQQNVGGQYTWYNDFRIDKHGYALHPSQPLTGGSMANPPARIRQALFEKITALTGGA